MWEYLVLVACVLVIIYFVFKYFERRKVDNIDWGLPPETGATRRFSKTMKPFYFGEGKTEETKPPPKLDKIASCRVCNADLNVINKMVCLKCLGVFCSKHLRRHKCKKIKPPRYQMARKKYEDGTTVYYPDRKEPLNDSAPTLLHEWEF